MEIVGSYEAKTHLPSLLERVTKGERFTITRHGVPIAMLIPVKSNSRLEVAEAIAAIKELRKGNVLGGQSIREMIEEGRH